MTVGWGGGGEPGAGLLQALGEAVLATDPDGRITYRNPAAQRLLGSGATTGSSLPDLLGVAEVPPWGEELDGRRLVLPSGSVPGAGAVLLSARALREGGAITGWAVVLVDLASSGPPDAAGERRLRSLLGAVSELVTVHDVDMRPRYVAGRGMVSGTAVPDLRDRVHPDDRPQLEAAFARWVDGEEAVAEYRARSRSGAWRSYESTGMNLLDDPAVGGIVVTTRNVDERVRMQQELVRRTLHDPLTQLPVRVLFLDRLEQALARGGRLGGAVALLRLDIDGFRAINETHGHAVGDAVLRGVAQEIRAAVPPGDTVARLGGDEFAVCGEQVGGRAEAEALAHRILMALERPLRADDRSIPVGASIGIAVLEPDDEVDAQTALHHAEVAVLHAKAQPGRGVAVFDTAMGSEQLRRARLRRDLLAVDEQQLAVHYQPQVRLGTGELTGFEALLRWQHPVLGPVSPDEFIPLAEETGLILPLGRHVLETACRELAGLRADFPDRDLTMAVNVSSRQLVDDTLADFLGDLLERTGLEPSALCLELTESAVMERGVESERRLRRLKQRGVQLAIDDFGTGYSSLAYLKRFPLDQVKIDREFVWGLGTDHEDALIIASVARLGASLQLEVVAEGVETAEQRDELSSLGCELGQGYLWSRPRPAAELRSVLAGSPGWEPAVPGEDAVAVLEDAEAPDLDEVVAVLRHELANPVTVIRGYTELLQQSGGGAELPVSALDAISRSTAGLQSLIVALTDLRHIGAGTVRLDRRPLDLGAVVRDILAELRGELAGRAVAFLQDEAVRALADRVRVRQIVRTLLDNAVRHTPARTAIEVAVRAAGSACEVAVTDRGPGIRADQVGQLFRKFSRLGAQGEGTGLGLFVARGFARAHGGDLRYAPPPDGPGARFVLTLPAAVGEVDVPG